MLTRKLAPQLEAVDTAIAGRGFAMDRSRIHQPHDGPSEKAKRRLGRKQETVMYPSCRCPSRRCALEGEPEDHQRRNHPATPQREWLPSLTVDEPDSDEVARTLITRSGGAASATRSDVKPAP